MPVEFVTDEQAAAYGKFAEEPTRPELERFFFLDDVDRDLIALRRTQHHQLGFALVMCTVRYVGLFLKRKVGYTWRLREVMAQHQIFTATELVPLLRERGIALSASQVHRLVSGTPERLSLQVMAALCDILSCTPADLVATTAENAGVRKTATGNLPAPPANVAKLRPRAARILPDA